jgi:hypothetical protein
LPNFQVNFDLCVCVSLHENSHCFEWWSKENFRKN